MAIQDYTRVRKARYWIKKYKYLFRSASNAHIWYMLNVRGEPLNYNRFREVWNESK